MANILAKFKKTQAFIVLRMAFLVEWPNSHTFHCKDAFTESQDITSQWM
jgi:hypothetical protein